MKTMKKFFAILLAVMLVAALSVPALADSHDSEQGGAASITVSNVQPQNTYKVYKVFDATSDGTSSNISYTVMSSKSSAELPTGFVKDSAGNVFHGTIEEGVVTINNDALTADEITSIAAYVNGDTAVAEITTGEDENEFTVTNLQYGYYYITTTVGSLVTVDSTNPSANVEDKNNPPTLVANDVSDADAYAAINDVVTFTYTLTPGAGADSDVVITFTAPTGLTLGTITQGTNSGGTINNNTITFTPTQLDAITATDAENPDTRVATISVTATLNEIATTDNMSVKADFAYGNHTDLSNANVATENGTKTNSVTLYAFTGTTDNPTKLASAGFTVKQGDDDIKFVTTANGYRVATAAEIDDGDTDTVNITTIAGDSTILGLDSQKAYTLTESATPAGYNKLLSPVSVAEESDETTFQANGKTVAIQYNAGAELPSTGGVGTTIFYVVGGVLIVGALVFFVTKRRIDVTK